LVILAESSFWPVVGVLVLGFALFYFLFSPGSGSLVPLGSQGGFAGPSYSAHGASGKQISPAAPGKVGSSPAAGPTPSPSPGSKSSDKSGSGGGSYLGEGIAGLVVIILVYFLLKGGRLGRLASGGSRLMGGAFGRIRGRPAIVRPPVPPIGTPHAPSISPAVPKKPSWIRRLVSGSGGKLSVKPARDRLFFGEQAAIDAKFVASGPGVPAPGFVAFEILSGPAGVSLEKNGALAPGDEIDQANKILKLVPDRQGNASALFSAGDEKGNAQVHIFTIPAGPGSFMHEKKLSIKIVPPPKPKVQAIKRIDISAKSAASAKSDFALVLKAEPSKIAFGEVSRIAAKPACKDRSFDWSKIEKVAFSIFEDPSSVKAPAGISLSSGDTSVSAGPELSAGIVRGAALALLKAGNEAGNVEIRAHFYSPSGDGIEAKSISVKIVPKHGVSPKAHIKDLRGIYSRAKESIEGAASNAFAGALSIRLECDSRALAPNDKIELRAKIVSRKKDVDASKFGPVYFEIAGDTHGAYIGDEKAFRRSKNKISIPVGKSGSASVFLTSGMAKGRAAVRAFFYKDAYKLEPVYSSKLSIDILEKPQDKKPAEAKPIAPPEPEKPSGEAIDMSNVSLEVSPENAELSFNEQKEFAAGLVCKGNAALPDSKEMRAHVSNGVPHGVQCFHKTKHGWHDNTGRTDFNIPVSSKGIAILKFIAGGEAGDFTFTIFCTPEGAKEALQSREVRVRILPADAEKQEPRQKTLDEKLEMQGRLAGKLSGDDLVKKLGLVLDVEPDLPLVYFNDSIVIKATLSNAKSLEIDDIGPVMFGFDSGPQPEGCSLADAARLKNATDGYPKAICPYVGLDGDIHVYFRAGGKPGKARIIVWCDVFNGRATVMKTIEISVRPSNATFPEP